MRWLKKNKIVVSCLGLLSLILISFFTSFTSCKGYDNRTYIAAGFALVSEVKIESVEFYEKHGRFPNNNQEIGLLEADKIIGHSVKSVEIKGNGRILITYNHKVFDGAELYLVPIIQDEKITWECRESDDPIKRIDLKTLPHSCRSAIMDKS